MQISFLIAGCYGGGVEGVSVLLANGFAAQGITVDFIVLNQGSSYDVTEKALSSRVKLTYFSAGQVQRGIRGKLRYLYQFKKYLFEKKPDVLITTGYASDWLGIVGRTMFLRTMKVIVTVHITPSTYFLHAFYGDSFIRRLITSCIYRFTDRLIAVSQGSAKDIRKYYHLPEQKVGMIYNPVIPPEIAMLAEDKVDHPWFQPSSPPVILSAGRLFPLKNHKQLIKAFAIVRQQHNCKLMILGEGPHRESLEKLVNELGINTEVALPGFSANPYAYMSKAKVFVLSSLSEALASVLIEALACGCPVISTDCPGGTNEVLKNGRYGTLVPVGDIHAMADAIGNVLAGKKLPCTKEEGIARSQDFRVENAVKQYVELITGLAQR